jgi:AcrR family transcriptional regulator
MKDENYFNILNAVLRLEVVKGHLRWKIADVSRLSGVQRTLIYYYFGKSKEAILENAMKSIGDEFFGFTPERLQLWKEGRVKEAVMRTREMLAKAPHLVEFFFHWRHQKGEIASMLKSLERKYPKKLREVFPHLSEVDAEAAFTIFWGMVLMPDLDEEVAVRILKVMKLHP